MKRVPFSFDCYQSDTDYGDVFIEASGTCTPGTKGSAYDRNGDPGNAPEDGDVEFVTVKAYDENDAVIYDKAIPACEFTPDWDDLKERARRDAFRW